MTAPGFSPQVGRRCAVCDRSLDGRDVFWWVTPGWAGAGSGGYSWIVCGRAVCVDRAADLIVDASVEREGGDVNFRSIAFVGRWYFGLTVGRFSFFVAWKCDRTMRGYAGEIHRIKVPS